MSLWAPSLYANTSQCANGADGRYLAPALAILCFLATATDEFLNMHKNGDEMGHQLKPYKRPLTEGENYG